MKNIHLVPTDKATGIFESNNNLHFSIIEKVRSGRDRMFKGYHIYITSEEEIKDNDWFLLDMSHSDILPDEIHQMGGNKRSKTGGINFSEPNSWTKSCKKIILTTDQDLITDGVQSINDEFLGWYSKNSSCESVEVADIWKQGNPSTHDSYQLIIPQEEPKQVICHDKLDRVIQDGYYVDVQDSGIHKVHRKEDGHLYFKPYGEEERVSSYFSNDLILTTIASKNIADLKKEITNKKQEEPKQETVEEAAEKWVFETNGHKWSNDDDTAGDNYGSFREGAKWMLEKLQDFDTWKEWKDINFK
jgi:hypothetical protein